jgi:hypothetical protein
MSKRIMNEVRCTAEDNGIDFYYTDTDSSQMDASKMDLLKLKYYEKYGRELDGKG